MARNRNIKNKAGFKNILGKILLNSQALPLVIVFTTLGILFVLIRMKGIEQDYRYNEVVKKMNEIKLQNKELKAKRASLLSVKELRAYSKKFNLQDPDESHIIVIP